MMIKKLKAFSRLNEIKAVKNEMECLQDTLHTALMERGRMSKKQRMEVLKRLVDQCKEESRAELLESQSKTIENEEANDVVKSISFFNLI